jgi:phosphoglycerate kinase
MYTMERMKTLEHAGDLEGKKVLMRADFDVPVSADGIIEEPFRIMQQKATLEYLRDHGAQVTLIAHISAVPSFMPLMPQLQEILGPITLLENLRSDPGEEANDPEFAKKLAEGFDLYVNNAFAVCHRAHASMVALPALLPSYAGLLVQEEVRQLSGIIDAPAAGKVIYMGGAKVSTKMPVIEYLKDKAETIAVGGAIANEIGAPSDARILVATDFIMEGDRALDIGPQSAASFAALAADAKLIVWNGPMGKCEDERYAVGTRVLAEAISRSSATKVIGGGDTVAAVDRLGLLSTMGFVSTGGGAMLAFLAGQQLPGLNALE